MPTPPTPDPDPSKPISSATQVLRTRPDDVGFEADFADLAARFAAHSGGGLSPELSADLALEIVLNEIVEQACLSTGATGAAIALHRDGELVCRASSGSTAPELGVRLDSASSLSGECIRTRLPQRCDDVLADLRVDVDASQRLGVRSVMVMPLLQDGELAGVFELFSSLPSAFGERDERTLEALAGRILAHLAISSGQHADPAPVELSPRPINKEAREAVDPLPVYDPLAGYQTLASGTLPEFMEAAPNPPPRGFDLVTTLLGIAVVACALLLGVLLGRHFVFQKAAVRPHPAGSISDAASAAAASEASVPGTAPVQESSAAAKPVAANAAAPSTPIRVENEGIAPGSLRVFDNGKEVFRQSAASEAGPVPAAKQGSGMQRAASIVPERASAAAENLVLHRVEPEYPESARRAKIQGPVVLDVQIGPNGAVQQATVISGQALLAQAARDAVQQWRFRPRVADGRPVTMQTRITLNFRLPQ
jgi:TonB family protein